jgi:hypothetical protein
MKFISTKDRIRKAMLRSARERTFKVDFNDIKSIKKAEKIKSQLENKGYDLDSAKRTSFDKYLYTYKKLRKVL